jgi:predicted transcriptional regulator
MLNYKVTNLRTGVIERLNHSEVILRIKACKGKYRKMYSDEHISDTPIQDKLNKAVHSTIDVIFYFAMSLALGVLALEYLTHTL